MQNNSYIYLDNASTTKVDNVVIETMISCMSNFYANSASTHKFGEQVNLKVEHARQQVAELINANKKEITFTSGATESINTILKGIYLSKKTSKNKIITVQTEHNAVLDTCKYLETLGADVIYLPVKSDGIIDLDILKRHIDNNTLLVCVMLANNETGVLQDINKISRIVHQKNSLILTDATQAVGKILVDVRKLEVDFLAFSGHKFYGPKGIGGLYIKSEHFNKIETLIHGGGHENSKRSGTLNVPSIVGLGVVCEISIADMSQNEKHITPLQQLLENGLLEINGAFINGNSKNRIYNITNVCIPGVDADILIKMLDNIYISNGSACSSALIQPSHVLNAMGLDDTNAFSSIRLSLGKENTLEEIKTVIDRIKKIVNQLKSNYV